MTGRQALWTVVGVAAAAVAMAGGIYFGLRSSSGPGADAATLLALSLPDTSGHQQALDQWKGKVIFVNFWATWCAPCREEMPEFVKAQRELGPKGLQFIGIAVDEPEKAERFAKELELNYPVLVGGYGAIELSRTLGNRVVALPFTIVVDRKGRVAHTQLGPLKPGQITAIASGLL